MIAKVSGPGVRTVSPPMSGQRYVAASSPRPAAKAASQSAVQSSGSARIERETDRLGAFGGEVGEIDPQRLARDRGGRIVGEEMHAGDHGVRRDDEIAARRRFQQGDVVLEPEPGGTGKRRKKSRDQIVFAGTVGPYDPT